MWRKASYLAAHRSVGSKLPSHGAVAFAAWLCCGAAAAQSGVTTVAPNSADLPEAKSLFEVGNQGTIAPRPFASFLERIASPVEKIELSANLAPLPADGVGRRSISLRLMGKDGVLVRDAVEVTIEASGGVRVLLPGRNTDEAGPGRGDIDKMQPGTQLQVKGGEATFELIAPHQPEEITLRVSVKGAAEKVVLRYVPDLRELIAVGLLEGRLRADKFDPRQLVPARDNDGFEQELKSLTREFNGGKGHFGARAALYLKGKVKGEYLLTLAYDSDKDTAKPLFNTIDPNAFYPVYGDASTRGADAQSAHKLFVRLV
jgi:hypothetical protein